MRNRYVAALVAGIAAMAFALFPGGSSASTAGNVPQPGHGNLINLNHHRTSTFDVQDYWFNGCERDPNSGGLGTNVTAQVNPFNACGTGLALDWVFQANGTCGGKVTTTCPGGDISAFYPGDFIITIKNAGQGSLCEGADAATAWLIQMATCDGVNGLHHYNTLFVWAQSAFCGASTGTALISWQWQKNGNSGRAFIGDTGGNGSIITVLNGATHCQQLLWDIPGS